MSSALVCISDYQKKAEQILEKKTAEYYGSGAGEQFSLTLNTEAFKRLRILPKYLQNVAKVDTTCNILGCDLNWPLGIAPSAFQKLAHQDGEAGNARAAGEIGSVYILGTLATMSIEDVAAAAPNTNKWFQLFVYKDRSLTEQLVRRAEKCNFKAIVLTIDASVFGQRWVDARNNFKLPPHLRLANFGDESALSEGSQDTITDYVANNIDTTLTWRDIKWLVGFSQLPVIVKGILTTEGAVLAREAGCAGIIVSNHGARHLDGLPASIEVLPEIVRAVGNEMVVMLDGGIRSGNDIFKALALGAKMVLIGRPAVWGLACGGEEGVKEMLRVLRNDLIKIMTLAGCPNLNAITKNMIVHESTYSKL